MTDGLDIPGFLRRVEPHDGIIQQCSKCGDAAEFGYRIQGEMQWFCDTHRLAKHYADARVPKAVGPAPRNDPLAEHANAIRQHVEDFRTRTIQEIVEIGKHLVAAKELCGHGNWLPWLRREFGWSEGIGHRFMQVSRLRPDQIRKLVNLDLPVSAVYELAAPSTPEAARQDVIERAESGERVSVKQVKQTITEARNPNFRPEIARLAFFAAPDPPPNIERKKIAAGLTHARGMSLATLDQFIIELRQLRREKRKHARA